MHAIFKLVHKFRHTHVCGMMYKPHKKTKTSTVWGSPRIAPIIANLKINYHNIKSCKRSRPHYSHITNGYTEWVTEPEIIPYQCHKV